MTNKLLDCDMTHRCIMRLQKSRVHMMSLDKRTSVVRKITSLRFLHSCVIEITFSFKINTVSRAVGKPNM